MSETTTINGAEADVAGGNDPGSSGSMSLTTGQKPVQTEDLLAGLNRQLPFSDEAEKGVNSCVLQDPEEGLGECRIDLPAEAFYHTPNRTIYATMLAMADANPPVPIDPVSLSNVLRDQGLLERVGGSSAISELYTFVPIAAHFDYFRKVVKQKWRARQLIHGCAEIMTRVHEFGKESPDENADDLIAFAQEKMFAITAHSASGDGGQDYKEVIDEVLTRVEEQLEHAATIPAVRVPFGFCDLDRMVWGFVRGQLVIIGGRPSMGKSALAMNIYGNVSRGEGDYREWNLEDWPHRIKKHVMVINQEMTNIDSGTRDLVGGAGVDLQATRYGLPTRDAQQKLANRHRQIWRSNIRMYDAPGMSIQKLRALARARKRKHGLDLVVIDYLQLMHSESRRAQGNRQQEIAEISSGLKEMAKELDCVVLALAQLARSVEERKDKKPILADLRESGSIEQDADVVMFVHRPWYYDKEQPADLAQLIVAKGRNVGIGEIELRFKSHITTFQSTTDRLLSNNDEQRQHGYQSKPQPCKQPPPAEPEEVQEEFES